MQTLDTLGPRVCIFGPSNSGKSTLAVALGTKLDVPAIHLDLFYHTPHTNWMPRKTEDFERLHDQAIAGDGWVIEGNYTRLVAKRLARATGIVLIDTLAAGNLLRYVRRALFERRRAGALEGGQDSLKWSMIHHISMVQPRARAKMARLIADSSLPYRSVKGMRGLNSLYQEWGLQRP